SARIRRTSDLLVPGSARADAPPGGGRAGRAPPAVDAIGPGVFRTLSKPAGLPVFPPHADPAGDCLLARLLAEEPWRAALPWPAGFDGGIAHRLDVSTSGAVLAASDPDAL